MSGVVHITKFMGGKMSPEEAHRAYAIRSKCACGQPGAIQIRALVQLKELTERRPEYVAAIASTNPNGPYVPTVATKYGPMVIVGRVVACSGCRAAAERAAASAPSWVIIEIDRGPGPDRPLVQVA